MGADDPVGNAWEWCLNDPDPLQPNATASRYRATLGGSWNSQRQDAVVQHRAGYDLKYWNLNTGFRIVRIDA